ncbi:T9SS type A sorting domain-containing protein [Psychroflexus sp. MBR-150]|jgi:hypothetical protein
MKKITLLMSLLFVSLTFSQTSVFVNEIHYDNSGSDADEGIEIAGPAGTDLSGWTIEKYNGNNSSTYGTESLSGVIPDQDNGYGTLSFLISGLQNGAPDGLALVDDSGTVIQFLSYEGTITAVDGPASGMTSEDIGVEESSSSPVGESLQLTGSGTVYENFTWADSSPSSFGSVNANQTFGGTPIPSLSVVDAEPSGSNAIIAPNELDQTQLEFEIINFTIGEPGTATEADGYVSWEILNLTDGGTHQSGNLFDLANQPISITPFEAGKTYQLNAVLKDNSDVDLPNTEASYTITLEALGYIQVADITALRADVDANGLGRFYEITGPSTFTHGDGFQNRKWFQDATPSGIFVQDFDGVIPNGVYAEGDQVSGLKGFTREENGVLTFEPIEDAGTVSGSTSVSPLVLTLADYNANFETYESLLVGFENVTFTDGDGTAVFNTGTNYEFSNGTDVSDVRTEFFGADYIGTVIPDTQIDGIVGLAAEFNGSTQIYPRSLADIDVTLGLNDVAVNNFSLYPNPVNKGSFNIKSQNNQAFDIEVYNVLGKRVLEFNQIQNQNINVSQLQSGVYLVKINQNEASTTKKLIIK